MTEAFGNPRPDDGGPGAGNPSDEDSTRAGSEGISALAQRGTTPS